MLGHRGLDTDLAEPRTYWPNFVIDMAVGRAAAPRERADVRIERIRDAVWLWSAAVRRRRRVLLVARSRLGRTAVMSCGWPMLR
jgi:hypothetical protein